MYLGTSGIRLLLLAQDHVVVAETSVALSVSHPQWSKQDPAQWWQALSDGGATQNVLPVPPVARRFEPQGARRDTRLHRHGRYRELYTRLETLYQACAPCQMTRHRGVRPAPPAPGRAGARRRRRRRSAGAG